MSDCSHEWYETTTLGVACLKCGEEHQDVETLLNTKEDRIAELQARLDTAIGGLQSICDTHGYAIPKPVLNNLLAALGTENDDE